MAISRSTLAMASGDPGFFDFLRRAGGAIAGLFPGGGIVSRAIAPTARAGGLAGAIERIGTKGKIALGAGGGAIALGAGAEAVSLFGGARGGVSTRSIDGMVEILNRRGRPVRLITASGKVVNLQRRSRGISAAALRGAFRLARIAHAFAGTARSGRRPRRHRA